MKTLGQAWRWYQATKRSLVRLKRLGSHHWEDPSLELASLWQDDAFRTLESEVIVNETDASLEPIDDLAIVFLFSIFESQVRNYLVNGMEPEERRLTDVILREAAADAIQGVKEGSFYRRVLDPLKKQDRVSADLVTQVDQVRTYRNWVAHGRRERPTNVVTPTIAYQRLRDFLKVLDIDAGSDENQATESMDESL